LWSSALQHSTSSCCNSLTANSTVTIKISPTDQFDRNASTLQPSKVQVNNVHIDFFYHVLTAPSEPGTPYYRGLVWTSNQPGAETSTSQHTTLQRDTSMTPAGFEHTIPGIERPQNNALDRAATGIGVYTEYTPLNKGLLGTSHHT